MTFIIKNYKFNRYKSSIQETMQAIKFMHNQSIVIGLMSYKWCQTSHNIVRILAWIMNEEKKKKEELFETPYQQNTIPTLSPRCIDIEFSWALFSWRRLTLFLDLTISFASAWINFIKQLKHSIKVAYRYSITNSYQVAKTIY